MTGTIAQFNRFLPDGSFCAQFSCKTIEVVIGSLFLMASRSEEVCSKLHTCVFLCGADIWKRAGARLAEMLPGAPVLYQKYGIYAPPRRYCIERLSWLA